MPDPKPPSAEERAMEIASRIPEQMTYRLFVYEDSIREIHAAEKAARAEGRREEREACAIVAENFSTVDGYEIAFKIRNQALDEGGGEGGE